MKHTKNIERLNKLFTTASSARLKMDKIRVQWEEFYWNDVNNTKSQFDKQQMQEIKQTYNIPISTKICYPIVEQQLSFLTGTKPFPKLIASTEENSLFSHIYSEGYKAVWYESKSNEKLKNALRDFLVVGQGFLKVRTNDIFGESSFNVIHEYVRWKHVYIDPESRATDISDAEYIILAFPMPKSKAEKKYDIKIDHNLTDDYASYSTLDDDNEGYSYTPDDQKYLVTIKEFYEKEEKSVYITENGDVSLKRPKSIMVPNPKKIQLKEAIEQVLMQLEGLGQTQQQQQQEVNDIDNLDTEYPNENELEGFNQEQEVRTGNEESKQQILQLEQQLQQLNILYGQEPSQIPAYELINEKGEKIISFEPIKTTKKRIKRTLVVGNKILESEYLPIENYPIIPFFFQHGGIVNKTYSMMHYLMDLQKFLNKTYAALIYDMQLNNRPKLLVPQGAIIEKKLFEDAWSLPGAILEYTANERLPNGGKPEIINPSPLSQVTTYVIQQMTQLIEYVSGIHGVMQGSNQQVPNTASAVTSLQNFGSQRIKLYARTIEPSLEMLALSTIEHLQHYAPKDKQLEYIDDELKEQAIQLFNVKDDLKCKVRVDIVNDLPTVKHQLAAMLSSIAGQTSNPYVADALTKEMLKLLGTPSMLQLAENIDAMKQMQQQIEQLQEQLNRSQGTIKALEHNMVQSEIKSKVKNAVTDAEADIYAQTEILKNNLNSIENINNPIEEF